MDSLERIFEKFEDVNEFAGFAPKKEYRADTKEEIRHMRANAERDLQHHEVGLPVGRPPWAPRFCLSKKHLYYAHMIVGALRETHSDKIN